MAVTTTTTESETKLVTLRSADGEEFEIEESVAMESQTIRHMIEDECANNVIPLPNVNGQVLSKVIEYCKKRADSDTAKSEDKVADGELKAWDADFVKLDMDSLFELTLAANYLDIKSLLDLVCQTIADTIKDMSVEEVRDIFHITNDFTPEEEAAIRRENQWAFE